METFEEADDFFVHKKGKRIAYYSKDFIYKKVNQDPWRRICIAESVATKKEFKQNISITEEV